MSLVWGGLTRSDLAERNAQIVRLWVLGKSRREIAALVGLTPQRISQIVKAMR